MPKLINQMQPNKSNQLNQRKKIFPRREFLTIKSQKEMALNAEGQQQYFTN